MLGKLLTLVVMVVGAWFAFSWFRRLVELGRRVRQEQARHQSGGPPPRPRKAWTCPAAPFVRFTPRPGAPVAAGPIARAAHDQFHPRPLLIFRERTP